MSQTISRPSTVLFSNEWVTVDTVPAVTASGKVYQHMRVTPRTGLGVVVVPYAQMLGTTYVGMIQQDRPAINARTLEFPRGSVDAGRTVEEMAIIELSQKKSASHRSAPRDRSANCIPTLASCLLCPVSWPPPYHPTLFAPISRKNRTGTPSGCHGANSKAWCGRDASGVASPSPR